MERLIATLILVACLCLAFSDGQNSPGIVNFLGAIGFLCSSVWLGNILALRSVKNG